MTSESTFTEYELAALDKYRYRLTQPSSGTILIGMPMFPGSFRVHPRITAKIRRMYSVNDFEECPEHEHFYEYSVYVGDTMVLYESVDACGGEALAELTEECFRVMEAVSEYINGNDREGALDRMMVSVNARPVVERLIKRACKDDLVDKIRINLLYLYQ